MIKKTTETILFLATLTFGLRATPVQAIACFDVLIEDTELDRNLLCDCGENEAALTLDNGATLKLNGCKVSCQYTADCCQENEETYVGIKILGEGSKIEGPGTVTESHTGIWIAGGGNHEVLQVTVRDTANDAISINSNNNKVEDCRVIDAGRGPDGDTNGDGIDVGFGFSGNTIKKNTIRRAGDDGIDCDGDNNVIEENKVIDTVFEDAMVIRGYGNIVKNNMIVNPGGDGIDVKCNKNPDDEDDCTYYDNGSHEIKDNIIRRAGKRGMKIATDVTKVQNNRIRDSAEDGMRIYGEDDVGNPTGRNCEIKDNSIRGSGEQALELEASNCRVQGNSIMVNLDVGLQVEGVDNDILDNVVKNNLIGILIDESATGNDFEANTVKVNVNGNIVDNSDGSNTFFGVN